MLKNICYSDLPLLTQDILSNVQRLIDYGADKVELMMDGDKWDEMEHLFPTIAKELKALPVGYTVHPPAWDINLTSENRAIREASFHEYRKAIEFANMIGAQHVVIHPGFCFCPSFNKELGQQRAKAYIQQLCEIAKPLNVKLAIENVGYNGSSLFTQGEYTDFLSDVDDTAGYLIDIGHAHLNHWAIPETIKAVKERLVALHIHDNSGTGDDHLPIGEGEIEWGPIFNMLVEEKVDCQLILEYAPETDLALLEKGKALLLKEISGCIKVD